jgi:hypothetical protein
MRLFILLFICLFICESSFAARNYTAYFYKAQLAHAPDKTFYLALLAFVAQSKNKNGSVEPIKKTTYRLLKLTDAYPEAEKIKNHPLYEVLSSAQLFSNKEQKQLINGILGNLLLVSDKEKINEIRKIFDNGHPVQQGELFFRGDDCSRLYQAYGELIYQDKVEKYDGAKDMIGNWARALLHPIYTYLEIEKKDDKQKVYDQILGNGIYKPTLELSAEITKIIDGKRSRREVQMQEKNFQDILTFSPVTEEDESKLMLQLFDKKTKSALGFTDVPSEEKGGASI